MNKLRHIITVVLCAITITSIAQTPNKSVKFDEIIHDFGTIDETAGKVSHRFRFTNVGNEPVVMLYARAGCGCVHADIPKQPIQPGKTGIVTVTFDPNYRPGHFSKEIALVSDGKKFNRIWVKGDVKPGKHPIKENFRYEFGHGLYMNFKRMVFGTIKEGEEKTMKLKFANDYQITMQLTFEIEKPDPDFTVVIPTGHILQPEGDGMMPITVRVNKAFTGERTVNLIPIANGYRLSPLPIVVQSRQ